MHKYSSKTVKNEGKCQILAINGTFVWQNEGKKEKIFKFFQKIFKKGLTNRKESCIISTSISFLTG